MKKTIRTLWAVALVAAIATIPAYAQDVYQKALEMVVNAQPAGNVLGAVNQDVAILIKHIGTSQASGKVAVAAAGQITLTSGAYGAEATDVSTECPISGALGGVIDTTNAACNTIGEVVDAINGNCAGCIKGNWVAIGLDSLRSDSTDNSLVTISATDANAKEGLALAWDTASVGFRASIAMVPAEARSIDWYLQGGPDSKTLKANAFLGTRAVLLQANATSTYSSGTSTFNVYSVLSNRAANNGLGSETVHNIYGEPGGATTVSALFGGSAGFGPYGVYGRRDEKLLARVNNSAVMSAVVFRAYGWFFSR